MFARGVGLFATYLFATHRVGRQGTLLCKEINIGYLERLNYLPLRGENEVNTSVFIAEFLQNLMLNMSKYTKFIYQKFA